MGVPVAICVRLFNYKSYKRSKIQSFINICIKLSVHLKYKSQYEIYKKFSICSYVEAETKNELVLCTSISLRWKINNYFYHSFFILDLVFFYCLHSVRGFTRIGTSYPLLFSMVSYISFYKFLTNFTTLSIWHWWLTIVSYKISGWID